MVSTADLVADRNARRQARRADKQFPLLPAAVRVGDVLTEMIRKKTGKPPCMKFCKATAEKMNKSGVPWCRENADELAEEIHQNVQRMGWGESFKTAAIKAIDAGLSATIGNAVYRQLVLDACDIAEPKQIELPPGAIVLNADKHGFGDAMVTAWVSEGSKGTDKPLIHHATGAKAELLRLFGQEVTLAKTKDMQTTFAPGGREAAGMRITRLEHRAEHLKAGGTPRRPQVIELSDDVKAWADNAVDDKTILLFPQAAHQIRTWPAAYWLELCRLLTDSGWSPLVCLENSDVKYRTFKVMAGMGWKHILALAQRSRLVITNSSGPAHVCGTMGASTLVVCGPTDPKVAFGHLDTLRCVYEESLDCVRCHYRAPKARPACWVGCEALHSLSPAKVLGEAIGMLAAQPLYETQPEMWRQVSADRVSYDDAYFAKYEGYAQTKLGEQLTAARVELVKRHRCESVLDVGIGCGSFVEAFGNAQGFDVMPKAIEWLESRGLFRSPYGIHGNAPDAITCWDSLEHIEQPGELLDCVKPGMHLFVSLPIFRGHDDIRQSKHYRPGEHLTYWTHSGFIDYCSREGLALVESNLAESLLGREAIRSYVFRRQDVEAVNKTAYIVSGPRSAGNRLLASILVRSGCGGSGSTIQPHEFNELQTASGPFVIIKHGDNNTLREWIPALRAKGYERIVVLIVLREPVANVSSMTARGHFTHAADARRHIARSISHAATDALADNAELEFVTYEGLTEAALKEWLPTVGLPYVPGSIECVGQDAPDAIENANATHYRT